VDSALRALAQAARAEVASGVLRGPALLARLVAVPARERDAWANELLGIDEIPADGPDLPPGGAPYLPAGVDEILTLVREAPLRADDELIDLGSGLGRVAILAHLLSGARVRGIEVQQALVRRAASCRDALGLGATDVSFIHADAADRLAADDAALDGSVFFLYAPFNGDMLARVLRRVEDVARRRPIVVGAVWLELAGQPWLARRASSHVAMALYDSCVPGVLARPGT